MDQRNARPSAMRRSLETLYLASALLGALAILGILLIMLLQVATRQAGTFLAGADDLTAWSCAAAVFFPLAHTFRSGELVRMGILLDRFKGATRRRIELSALLVAAAFVAFACYWAINLSYVSWEIDDRSQGSISVPMWIPQLSMSIGLAIFLVALIDEIWGVLQGHEPSFDRAARDRHAAGDFTADL